MRNPSFISIIRTIVIYSLMVIGAIIYSFPFVWMATTSTKVDRELFSGGLHIMPIRPNPVTRSPYLDDQYFAQPDGERARQVSAEIGRLADRYDLTPPDGTSRDQVRELISRGLYTRLAQRIPQEVWEGSLPALSNAIAPEVTEASVKETYTAVYRSFDIGLLLARSTNLVEDELGKGRPMRERFTNLTPQAATMTDRYEVGKSFARVSYALRDHEHVVLQQTFTTSFPVSELQRLKLYFRPDDTWHELWLTIEKDGKRYRARRSVVLANFTWMTVTWQEPSEDDNSLKVKSWILLDEQKGAGSITDPHQLRVTLELRKSTPTQAWLNKIGLNYQNVFNQIPFWRYVRVSLFLVLVNVVLSVLAASLIGFAFARLTWPGRDLCFVLMLAAMMIPPQVTMIPHFLIWKSLGAYDTLTPLWLGHIFGSAFFIFLMRQNLKGIPRELEDAARIDGCIILY